MARFYASIQGNRGEASRIGTTSSGISGHLRGWDIGARVACEDFNGSDEVSIQLTGGSHSTTGGTLIASAKRDGGKVHLELANTPIVLEAARKLLSR